MRNQFGERLFSIFFKTYTEKVWGMSCDEISSDWAAQRIKGLSLGAAILDGLRRSLGLNTAKNNGDNSAKTLIESFQYPRKGPGMMWEAAAAKVKTNGGEVLMGRAVEKIHYDEDSQDLDGRGLDRRQPARDLPGPPCGVLGPRPRADRPISRRRRSACSTPGSCAIATS